MDPGRHRSRHRAFRLHRPGHLAPIAVAWTPLPLSSSPEPIARTGQGSALVQVSDHSRAVAGPPSADQLAARPRANPVRTYGRAIMTVATARTMSATSSGPAWRSTEVNRMTMNGARNRTINAPAITPPIATDSVTLGTSRVTASAMHTDA